MFVFYLSIGIIYFLMFTMFYCSNHIYYFLVLKLQACNRFTNQLPIPKDCIRGNF